VVFDPLSSASRVIVSHSLPANVCLLSPVTEKSSIVLPVEAVASKELSNQNCPELALEFSVALLGLGAEEGLISILMLSFVLSRTVNDTVSLPAVYCNVIPFATQLGAAANPSATATSTANKVFASKFSPRFIAF
jgi:hypothetical protein